MDTIDSIVGILVIGAFFFIIGSRIYKHEKEHIDPILEKIKGWFHKGEDSSTEGSSLNSDYELDFLGKTK